MSAVFDVALPHWSPQQRVDLSSWLPHAIVINLATNDFADAHQTPVDKGAFVAAYQGVYQLLAESLQPQARSCLISTSDPHITIAVLG